MRTIALISCVKTKRNRPCKAKDMYISPLFKESYEYASKRCDKIYILSARYGLLEDDRMISPYQETLNDKTIHERKIWSIGVLKSLSLRCDLSKDQFLLLGGANYMRYIKQKIKYSEDPLQGLSLGMRISLLKKYNENGKE